MYATVSPSAHGAAASIVSVLGVDFTPATFACAPPLVSFIATQAGAFASGAEKVRTQTVLLCPSVTLPAVSDPAMVAPLPHPEPRLGVPANEVADNISTAAAAIITASAPVFLITRYSIITAPLRDRS